MDKFVGLGFRVYEGSERTIRKKEYGSPVRKTGQGGKGPTATIQKCQKHL